MQITQKQAKKVYSLVSKGLVKGIGQPEPGKLCVEAAICLALDLPHGDEPSCVGAQDRSFSIALNDANWSSEKARAKGLKRLSVAQLGSSELTVEQQREWLRLVVCGTVNKIVPAALRAAASIHPSPEHKANLIAEAMKCEQVTAAWSAESAAWSARSARSAAWSAEWASDQVLTTMAEIAVDAYQKVNAPGATLLAQIEA